MSDSNKPPSTPPTLEGIRTVIREELDLRLIKIEKAVNEVKRLAQQYENRFTLIDSRLIVMGDDIRSIKERLNAVEESLEIEAKETGGTIGERLERLEKEIANINAKLRAG